MINRQVRLKSRSREIPQAGDFEIFEATVPDLAENEVLVRNIFLSVDPAMRGWIVDTVGYSTPVAIGALIRIAWSVGIQMCYGLFWAARGWSAEKGGNSRRINGSRIGGIVRRTNSAYPRLPLCRHRWRYD